MNRLLPAFVMLAMISLASRARAEAPTAKCTVLEVQATHEKKGVDPKLEKFKSKLGKGILGGYDTFKLLREQSVSAEQQKPATVDLVNGKLTLLFKDKMGAQGGRFRLRFEVDLDNKAGKRVASSIVTFDSGDGITIGGEEKDGAAYLVALTCSAP